MDLYQVSSPPKLYTIISYHCLCLCVFEAPSGVDANLAFISKYLIGYNIFHSRPSVL